MILLLDTTEDHCGRRLTDMLDAAGRKDYEYVDTTEKKIFHCLGCNHCWLKTPGVCSIKDDYEPILKKMSAAGQVWLISDTKFGFVTYRAKNIIDRVMPLVTMNLHFQGKQMRHVLRYNHNPDFGIIFLFLIVYCAPCCSKRLRRKSLLKYPWNGDVLFRWIIGHGNSEALI